MFWGKLVFSMLKYKSKQDKAIIYHWWCERDIAPYHDLENPVVASIATLRAHEPTTPIYVIDCSDLKRPLSDWGCFPEMLQFEVIPWTNRYRPQNNDRSYYLRMCSRVWDIWEVVKKNIPENNILFSDSDVFWLSSPYPLQVQSDLFCCSGNTGVFYFDKRSEMTHKLFEVWKAYIALAFLDLSFRERIKSIVFESNCECIQDELIFAYIRKIHPEISKTIPIWENCLIDNFRYNPSLAKKAKNAHALKASVGEDRGRICLCFKEYKRSLAKTVGEDGIQTLFPNENPPFTTSIYSLSSITRDELFDLLRFTNHRFAYITNIVEATEKGWFSNEIRHMSNEVLDT